MGAVETMEDFFERLNAGDRSGAVRLFDEKAEMRVHVLGNSRLMRGSEQVGGWFLRADKGLKMMDSTIAMAQRTGESSSWVQRAKEAQRDIQRAYDTANAALAKLPFSEQDLQRALDQMAGKPDSP